MRVKSEERRQAILKIAKNLFTTLGVEKTSMSAIAKTLGGSKGTLYNYFSSKEEIFVAVMESAVEGGIPTAFRNLSPEKTLRAALLGFAYNYLKAILAPEPMAIHKMAINEAGRSNISQHFYENGPKKGWDQVSKFIDLHIEKGTINPCNSWIASIQLKGLIEAELLEPYELGVTPQPSDKLIDEVAERAIDSFLMIYKPTK